MDTGWTKADIKTRNCEWDLNPVPLGCTLRMYTGSTQADIKRRKCEWDLNQGRLEHLEQESEVFPHDHSI